MYYANITPKVVCSSKQCRMAVSVNTWQSITTAVHPFIKHLTFLSHFHVLLVIHGFQVVVALLKDL